MDISPPYVTFVPIDTQIIVDMSTIFSDFFNPY